MIGTRGSALALAQTERVTTALRRCCPSHQFVVQTVTTLGDRVADRPLSSFATTGVFVREIDRLLLDGGIDIAVHSLKDVPPVLTPGLVLAAFPERGDPRDALVSRDGRAFFELPPGARVGTSSVRRQAQLRAARPDLRYLDDLRGNVDTRLRKLARGDYDAIVLAAAGLERLGQADQIAEYLAPELCLPDAGQGIIAVAVRAADSEALAVVARIDDPLIRVQALAERAVLRAFGGGCKVPVAAFATVRDSAAGAPSAATRDTAASAAGRYLHLEGLVATKDGSRLIRASVEGAIEGAPGRALAPGEQSRFDGSAADPEQLGQALWARLVAAGAGSLLAEANDERS